METVRREMFVNEVDPSEELRVLIVEDSDDDAELVRRELRRAGLNVLWLRVETEAGFKKAIEEQDWDVVLSDYSIPSYGGMRALRDLQAANRDIPFIVVSGSIGGKDAVAAMKAGAHDYVLKGDLTRLPAAVLREVREARGRAEQARMREQLMISERMASAGTLAAGVAHEINNPLAVAIANLEYIAKDLARIVAESDAFDAPHAERASLGSVSEWLSQRLTALDEPLLDTRDALRRVRDIVTDVKIFSRPEDSGNEAVDIKRVVESSIRMAWNEVRHRARLERAYLEVPPVAANEARLGQVILNLLMNAAQAIPDGRASENEIRICLRPSPPNRVVFEISDTGAGIAKKDLERIFDPFFTTKPVGVGTGLGLSICHRIITDLSGTIEVESTLGKGTTFRVTLLSAVPADATLRPSASPPSAGGRARILVVDDEPTIAKGLQRLLSGEHEVVLTTSARDALARVDAGERFDVIFSDLMMPDLTGMDLYEHLRSSAPAQAERVVFMTGGAFTDRAQELLNQSTNLRVEKPFDIDRIESIIREMGRA